jgi:hypothetical protein
MPRPSSGAACVERTRVTMARSMKACTSSSRSTLAAPARPAATCRAITRPCAGSESQPGGARANLHRRELGRNDVAREEVLLHEPAEAPPDPVLARRDDGVCGMGSPSGWRKSAVTANQSAMPPTIAASDAARTKPSHG